MQNKSGKNSSGCSVSEQPRRGGAYCGPRGEATDQSPNDAIFRPRTLIGAARRYARAYAVQKPWRARGELAKVLRDCPAKGGPRLVRLRAGEAAMEARRLARDGWDPRRHVRLLGCLMFEIWGRNV